MWGNIEQGSALKKKMKQKIKQQQKKENKQFQTKKL